MKLDIQLFGGRGASSSGGSRARGRGSGSSKASISDLRKQEQDIRNQMTDIYNQNSGFARTDLKSVSDAREKWYSLQKQANSLRDKISKEESKMTKSPTNNKSKKTFVNSYGEATKREITTSTYKRQQKRQSREIMRRLGK